MYKNFIFLFVFFVMGTGTNFAQFFKFEEMTAILEMADEREEVEKYLEDKGYEFTEEEEEEDDKYTINYHKVAGDDEYFIRLTANLDLDVYTVALFTWKAAAWDYYNLYVHSNDYELVDTKKKKGGVFIYDYEGDDYDISMGSFPEEDGTTLYKIIVSVY